jgi:translation initiation factor IF-1
MIKEAILERNGVVEEILPGAKFRVRLTDEDSKGVIIICHLAGKMRKNFIKILAGDVIKVEISLYDTTQGRIVYRSKSGDRSGLGSTIPTTPVPPSV